MDANKISVDDKAMGNPSPPRVLVVSDTAMSNREVARMVESLQGICVVNVAPFDHQPDISPAVAVDRYLRSLPQPIIGDPMRNKAQWKQEKMRYKRTK